MIYIVILFVIFTCIPYAYAVKDDTKASPGIFGFISKKDKGDKEKTIKEEKVKKVEKEEKVEKVEKVKKEAIKPLPSVSKDTFTPEEVRATVKHYCETNQQYNPYKAFTIYDSQIDKDRKLQFIEVNNAVIKKDDYFYATANFKDIDTKEFIVLDFDVVPTDKELGISDIFIQKVDKKTRFTYDKTGNRIFTK